MSQLLQTINTSSYSAYCMGGSISNDLQWLQFQDSAMQLAALSSFVERARAVRQYPSDGTASGFTSNHWRARF